MHPSGAARLFQDEILQAAAAVETTAAAAATAVTTAVSAAISAAAEQTTTATGQSGNPVMGHLGNSAASATVTGQSHGMDIDVPPITAVQNHPPAHIVATVRHRGGRSVRGSTAREVHPANPHLLWCTKSHHWVHRDRFGDQRTCSACREKQQL